MPCSSKVFPRLLFTNCQEKNCILRKIAVVQGKTRVACNQKAAPKWPSGGLSPSLEPETAPTRPRNHYIFHHLQIYLEFWKAIWGLENQKPYGLKNQSVFCSQILPKSKPRKERAYLEGRIEPLPLTDSPVFHAANKCKFVAFEIVSQMKLTSWWFKAWVNQRRRRRFSFVHVTNPRRNWTSKHDQAQKLLAN